MNQQDIMQYMPHRPPMLLLHEVRLAGEGEATGAYHVRGDEEFLKGHFPGNPVVPGVMLCEMIAQTAGDVVHTACSLLRQAGSLIRIRGEATVEGELCCKGEFLLMLTQAEA